MKILSLLAVLACLFVPAFAEDTSAGDPGVQNGTCWKGGGHDISVKVRGNMMGESVVTVTDGSHSGEVAGTPDPDGGCADSPALSVDGQLYRVDSGEMQYKDGNTWKDMTEKKCPKKKATEINGGGAPASDQGGGDDDGSEELVSDDTIGGWPVVHDDHVAHP